LAKSHSTQSSTAPQDFRWARNAPALFLLVASLVFLGTLINNHHGPSISGGLWQGVDASDSGEPVFPAALLPVKASPEEAGYQRALADYLARRYRVSAQVTTNIVANAYAAGHKFAIDPMLILAVISVESSFNPIAESTMGAKGLMQVIPRYHADKFDALGGEKVAFETGPNIMVGAQILREYIRRTGDLADALQLYVGATSEENENGYSGKVMAERDRLHYVLRQYLNQGRIAQQPARPRLAPAI